MSACEHGTIPNKTYTVSVGFSRPMSARITEACNQCQTCCNRTITIPLLLLIFGIAVSFSFFVFITLETFCQRGPGMALESLRILDMAVYQNTTSEPPAWQVDSAFNVTLSTWNPNTIAKCFTTFRRVIVSVQYQNQTILEQEVPLGFGLKTRQSRPVAVELNGAPFQLRNQDWGPVLEAELQRSSTITLALLFDARYWRNDRKASWNYISCDVLAITPTSNSSGALLSQSCQRLW